MKTVLIFILLKLGEIAGFVVVGFGFYGIGSWLHNTAYKKEPWYADVFVGFVVTIGCALLLIALILQNWDWAKRLAR